jgi:archaellum component FlaC
MRNRLTESDFNRIVKKIVNETKEKDDTKFNKKWVGMINTRLKNGNLNSALEMSEDLIDDVDGMSNVVKHLKNAKSEIDKAKDKLNNLLSN